MFAVLKTGGKQYKVSSGDVLRVSQGETIELLAIGDGFPGRWGYYPWVISTAPDIASIHCKDARSFIPFREPGILFGGTVCSLIAHKQGNATLFFGNQFTLSAENYKDQVDVYVN